MFITISFVLVLFTPAECHCPLAQQRHAVTVTHVYSVPGADFTFVLDEFQQVSFTLVFQVAEDHLHGCLVFQHNDIEPQFSVLHRLAEELLFSVI